MNTENKEGHWSNSSVGDSEPQPCSGNAEDNVKDNDAERSETCVDQCLWHGQIHRRMQMMLRLDEKQQLVLTNRNNTKSHMLDAFSSTVMNTPIFFILQLCVFSLFVNSTPSSTEYFAYNPYLFLISNFSLSAYSTGDRSFITVSHICFCVFVRLYSRGQRCCSDWIATCAWR